MSWTTLAETGTPNNDHLTRGEGSRQPGGAQVDQGIGVSSFIAALSSGFAIFMLQLLLFLLLRNKLGRIFNEPKIKQRTRLSKPDVRSLSLISSIKLSWNSSDSDIARDCGLDAYFFLRYLRTLLLAFFPIATLVIPVLIPLNYVDGRGHQLDADGRAAKDHDNAQVTGLDTLAWGNITPHNAHRYWAHLVISILTIAWVCALFFYEMRAYIEIRQTHLTSAEHRSRPSAATILVDSIPAKMCTDSELRKLFNHFPGGVKNIWINRDFSLLLQLIDRRDTIVQQLEVAETTLIRNAHYAWKKGKAGYWRRLFRGNSKSTGIQGTSGNRPDPHESPSTDCEKDNSSGLWEKFLSRSDRPTHRLPGLGLRWLFDGAPFFEKVYTIKELEELNIRIEKQQTCYAELPSANSAFVQFRTQMAAHMACQSVIHHLPEHMAPRSIGFSPDEIIWRNIALSYKAGWVRAVITYVILFLMISLWSLPVAWTGALSQVDQLIQGSDLLSFIGRTEALRHVISAVAGLLPTTALTVLLILLPFLLEYLADFKGVKTYSLRQEFVQTFYFAFLFIQVFLVVSIASFFTASIKELATNVRGVQQASVVVNILAQNLPKASNYFFSYMVLQSFSTSAATLLQVGSLISHYIVGPVFDVSARDKWFRKTKPHSVKWGSVFPVYTNFACIALIYCIISPLISVFAILTFGLIWLAQRYAILNFYRSDHDTGGVLYPRALNQTFTGLYVMELCLTGLFFMAKDEKANAVCSAHAIIMAIALVATVLFQAFLNWRFAPLFRFLPVDLGNDEVTMTGQKKQVKDDLQLPQMCLEDVSNMDEKNEVSEHPRTNTTNKLSTEFPTTLKEVPKNQREILVDEAFKHYALTVRQPIIWIPRDGLHVSEDEIDQCKQISGFIDMSNDGAYLDDHGRVVCHDKPPDFSEFAYVKL
ncbi:hypothetical protein FOCG_17912 [Fusarium oxysporum f. sp. radicis-lycopersici 26381]|nr:hypothetical protein FOCG_17912 [Fusarium oxysporum f. sp. radicis-lycopersici 26381]